MICADSDYEVRRESQGMVNGPWGEYREKASRRMLPFKIQNFRKAVKGPVMDFHHGRASLLLLIDIMEI